MVSLASLCSCPGSISEYRNPCKSQPSPLLPCTALRSAKGHCSSPSSIRQQEGVCCHPPQGSLRFLSHAGFPEQTGSTQHPRQDMERQKEAAQCVHWESRLQTGVLSGFSYLKASEELSKGNISKELGSYPLEA